MYSYYKATVTVRQSSGIQLFPLLQNHSYHKKYNIKTFERKISVALWTQQTHWQYIIIKAWLSPAQSEPFTKM